MKRLCLPLVLAACTVTAPAAAQEATVRSGNWDMLRQGGRCGARLAGVQGATLTVWQASNGVQSILFSGQAFAGLPARTRLRLAVTRREGYRGKLKELRFDADATRDARDIAIAAETGLTLALWQASAIAVHPRGKHTTLAQFVPGEGGFPAEELRRCREDGERTDRGSGKPKVTDGALLVPVSRLITTEDYPQQALQNEWRGRTVLKLTVSAKGLVSGCAIATSSGHAILDQKACILYSHRARFAPALDADGAPTEAVYLAPVMWMVSE